MNQEMPLFVQVCLAIAVTVAVTLGLYIGIVELGEVIRVSQGMR